MISKYSGDKIWNFVAKTGGCWLWTGPIKQPEGYGRFCKRRGGKIHLAHRYIYVLINGPLPNAVELHHKPTCLKRCVTPDHLTKLTKTEHLKEPDSIQSRRRLITHCKRGHLLTGDNVYTSLSNTGRRCNKCRKLEALERKQRKVRRAIYIPSTQMVGGEYALITTK